MEREFEHRLTEVVDMAKSNKRRIENLEERQDDLDKLVSTVAVLAEREKNVEDNVVEIKTELKTLTGKSGKKWDTMVSQIIGIVVAAVAGFILAKIGL